MVINDGYSGCFVLELLEDFYGLLWEMLMEILEESDVIFQYSSVISWMKHGQVVSHSSCRAIFWDCLTLDTQGPRCSWLRTSTAASTSRHGQSTPTNPSETKAQRPKGQ